MDPPTLVTILAYTTLGTCLGLWIMAQVQLKRLRREQREYREELQRLRAQLHDLREPLHSLIETIGERNRQDGLVTRTGRWTGMSRSNAMMANFAQIYGGGTRPLTDASEEETEEEEVGGYMEPLEEEFTDRDFPPRTLSEGYYQVQRGFSVGRRHFPIQAIYHLSELDGAVRWAERVGTQEDRIPLEIAEQWEWDAALSSGFLLFSGSTSDMTANFQRMADGLSDIGPAIGRTMTDMVESMSRALSFRRQLEKRPIEPEKEPPTRFERLLADDGCIDPPEE